MGGHAKQNEKRERPPSAACWGGSAGKRVIFKNRVGIGDSPKERHNKTMRLEMCFVMKRAFKPCKDVGGITLR